MSERTRLLDLGADILSLVVDILDRASGSAVCERKDFASYTLVSRTFHQYSRHALCRRICLAEMTQVRGASLLETLMGPSELNAAVQHVCVESTDLNRHHPFGSMLAACPRLHSLHLAVEPTRLPDALTSDSDTISFGGLRQLSFDPCLPWHPPLVPAPSLPVAVLAVFPPSLRRLELHLGSCSGALETHSLLFDHDKSPRVQLPCLRELRIVMRPDRLSFDLVASIVVAMSGKRNHTLDLAFVPLHPHEIPLESLAAIPGVLVSFQHIKHLRLTCALRHVPASRSRSETLSFLADLTDACPSLITLALDRSTYRLAFSTPPSVQVLQLEYLAAGQLRAQEDCPDRAVINSGQLMRACQGILSSSNGSLAGVHTLSCETGRLIRSSLRDTCWTPASGGEWRRYLYQIADDCCCPGNGVMHG